MSGSAAPEELAEAKELADQLLLELADSMKTTFVAEASSLIQPRHGAVDNPYIENGWSYYETLKQPVLGSGTFRKIRPHAETWIQTYRSQVRTDTDMSKEVRSGLEDVLSEPTAEEFQRWLSTGEYPDNWNRAEAAKVMREMEAEFQRNN